MGKNKVVVVIIVYNIARLVSKQIECLRKFCKDDFDIIIVDNSTEADKSTDVRYYVKQAGVQYIKCSSAESKGSRSNAFACNFAYSMLKEEYDFFLYLDHDIFPIREFSVTGVLGDNVIAGVGQTKSKVYFMQNGLMWNNARIDHGLIDFSVNNELGLDTGGNLYKIIEKYGEDKCVFFNEQYYQNPYFREGFYNFYATFNDDMFMHFINGSGWNTSPNNEERINALINVLNEKVNG